MTSRKFKLALGVFTLLTSATAFAQQSSGYSVFDSSVIAAKNMPQQNEFWNNAYNFPAKPRNQVEVGASIGTVSISGDVNSRFPTFGFEAHVRKAIGYAFSVRLQYVNGVAKGLNWQAAYNWQKNDAFTDKNNGGNLPVGKAYQSGKAVYYNYKTKLQDLSIEGIVSLNNLNFHKQTSKLNVYAGAGFGATWFNVHVNALNAAGNNYATLFNGLAAGGNNVYSNRNDIYKALKAGMDNTYETAAESESGRRATLGNNTLVPSGTILGGVAYKLSNKVNIALEDRQTFVKTDLLDGQRWQEHPAGDAALTSNFDSYNYLSLGINFNLGKKAVQPLYWINPLDYAYSELNNPKHMKLPKPVLDDTDGDGITDQLDREPNTPAGSPVDAHGVARDTDGDGVPDFKDKQLITPTECQPVDADGVGKCPDPACCTAMKQTVVNVCAMDYPSLSLKTAILSADTQALLASVASKLKANPTCTITITAYPGASKAEQSLADKKLDAVKNYLVEKAGISADRVSNDKVIGGGDANTIDIKAN